MVPAFDKSVLTEKIRITTELLSSFKEKFAIKYKSDFGFSLPDREVIVDDVRIRAIGKTRLADETSQSGVVKNKTSELNVQKTLDCHFKEGCLTTSVIFIDDIPFHKEITGPTVIIDKLNTILVEPNCSAILDESGNVVINVKKETSTEDYLKRDLNKVDFVELSIFSHRFMSIAEQMGRVLQKTAISTNIKERLDFSCAMFGPDGGLVANAPHIPVHLGRIFIYDIIVFVCFSSV